MVPSGVCHRTVEAGLPYCLRMKGTWALGVAIALALLLADLGWFRGRQEPAVPVSKQGNTAVALSTSREGRALRVWWDARSGPVRDADQATLQIDDGTHHSRLALNTAEIRAGKLVYWPETDAVTMRMVVHSADGATRVIEIPTSTPQAPEAVNGPPQPKPSPFQPHRRPKLQQVSVTTAPEPISKPQPPSPQSPKAFFGKLADKIPLVRRFRKSAQPPAVSSD